MSTSLILAFYSPNCLLVFGLSSAPNIAGNVKLPDPSAITIVFDELWMFAPVTVLETATPIARGVNVALVPAAGTYFQRHTLTYAKCSLFLFSGSFSQVKPIFASFSRTASRTRSLFDTCVSTLTAASSSLSSVSVTGTCQTRSRLSDGFRSLIMISPRSVNYP